MAVEVDRAAEQAKDIALYLNFDMVAMDRRHKLTRTAGARVRRRREAT